MAIQRLSDVQPVDNRSTWKFLMMLSLPKFTAYGLSCESIVVMNLKKQSLPLILRPGTEIHFVLRILFQTISEQLSLSQGLA